MVNDSNGWLYQRFITMVDDINGWWYQWHLTDRIRCPTNGGEGERWPVEAVDVLGQQVWITLNIWIRPEKWAGLLLKALSTSTRYSSFYNPDKCLTVVHCPIPGRPTRPSWSQCRSWWRRRYRHSSGSGSG